ncbi:hypothetical protein BJ944DRAFT_155632, partial [Cunninghamella echinulata]
YCEVCDCSFPNNSSNRKKHNQGFVHINNKRRHYDWFKDPNDFIKEQIEKPPCRKYGNNGFCEYELDCKYSHITWDNTGKSLLYIFIIMIIKKQYHYDHKIKKNKRYQYQLPQDWKRQDLPPSLQPPPPFSTINDYYDWDHIGSWG